MRFLLLDDSFVRITWVADLLDFLNKRKDEEKQMSIHIRLKTLIFKIALYCILLCGLQVPLVSNIKINDGKVFIGRNTKVYRKMSKA